MSSTPSAAIDLQTQLVAASRERLASRLSQREQLTHGLTAAAFSVAAIALALSTLPVGKEPWLLVAVFVGAIALASRIELEVGSGFAAPVELVLLPMLFALPAGQVPAAVAVGLVLGQLPSYFRGQVPPARLMVALGNASYTLAPSLVFVLGYQADADPGTLALLTTAAVCAQFAGDALISTLREHFAVGVDPRLLIRPLGWTFLVDACLAPVGFAAALAGSVWSPAYLLPLPLLLLTRVFAHERTDRLTQTVELSAAYRGTAFLLGDFVQADDAYTGAHSRDVVELSVSVADHLGLDARTRHLTELTALLHDVGKIRIPKEIINKNGPLTPGERAIVNTHASGGRAPALAGRRTARRGRPHRPVVSRAVRRRRLPGRTRRRRHPDRRAHRVLLRRLQRHDDDTLV